MSKVGSKVEKGRGTPPSAAVPYQRSETEQRAIEANAERKARRIPGPPLKVISVKQNDRGGATGQIQVDAHPDVAESLFCESLGTADSAFASFISEQLGMLGVKGMDINANVINAHLALVRGIAPRDELETMLAAQMAAVHVLTLATASSLYNNSNGDNTPLNKLARTFAAQMDTLKRYRGSGEQKVVVEHRHYHLAPGAQAVFGDVTGAGGGGGQPEIKEQSHVRSIPKRQAVLGAVEALGSTVPGAGDEGQECVPVPRREGGSTLRAV